MKVSALEVPIHREQCRSFLLLLKNLSQLSYLHSLSLNQVLVFYVRFFELINKPLNPKSDVFLSRVRILIRTGKVVSLQEKTCAETVPTVICFDIKLTDLLYTFISASSERESESDTHRSSWHQNRR